MEIIEKNEEVTEVISPEDVGPNRWRAVAAAKVTFGTWWPGKRGWQCALLTGHTLTFHHSPYVLWPSLVVSSLLSLQLRRCRRQRLQSQVAEAAAAVVGQSGVIICVPPSVRLVLPYSLTHSHTHSLTLSVFSVRARYNSDMEERGERERQKESEVWSHQRKWMRQRWRESTASESENISVGENIWWWWWWWY